MHSFVRNTLYVVLLYPCVLGLYFKSLPQELENRHYAFEDTSEENLNNTLESFYNSSEISYNVSETGTDEQRLETISSIAPSENFRTEDSNSTPSSPMPSTKNIPNTQSSQLEITLTEIFSNESNGTDSVSQLPGSPSTSTGQIKSTSSGTSTNEGIIASSTEDDEQVVRGKPPISENATTTSKTETVYQKALALINDTYTLSILLPVAAGVIFASAILITLATCKCLKRQCRRRRLRKKILPDSVKHLRPSDRARLLSESSDEEF